MMGGMVVLQILWLGTTTSCHPSKKDVEHLLHSALHEDHAEKRNMQPNCAKKNRGEILVTRMAKFGGGKIWYKFFNSMAKFGTILLCQISPFQISPIPNSSPPPPVSPWPPPRSGPAGGGVWGSAHLGGSVCLVLQAPAGKQWAPDAKPNEGVFGLDTPSPGRLTHRWPPHNCPGHGGG